MSSSSSSSSAPIAAPAPSSSAPSGLPPDQSTVIDLPGATVQPPAAAAGTAGGAPTTTRVTRSQAARAPSATASDISDGNLEGIPSTSAAPPTRQRAARATNARSATARRIAAPPADPPAIAPPPVAAATATTMAPPGSFFMEGVGWVCPAIPNDPRLRIQLPSGFHLTLLGGSDPNSPPPMLPPPPMPATPSIPIPPGITAAPIPILVGPAADPAVVPTPGPTGISSSAPRQAASMSQAVSSIPVVAPLDPPGASIDPRSASGLHGQGAQAPPAGQAAQAPPNWARQDAEAFLAGLDTGRSNLPPPPPPIPAPVQPSLPGDLSALASAFGTAVGAAIHRDDRNDRRSEKAPLAVFANLPDLADGARSAINDLWTGQFSGRQLALLRPLSYAERNDTKKPPAASLQSPQGAADAVREYETRVSLILAQPRFDGVDPALKALIKENLQLAARALDILARSGGPPDLLTDQATQFAVSFVQEAWNDPPNALLYPFPPHESTRLMNQAFMHASAVHSAKLEAYQHKRPAPATTRPAKRPETEVCRNWNNHRCNAQKCKRRHVCEECKQPGHVSNKTSPCPQAGAAPSGAPPAPQ
ncbi:hypothetical protein HDU96_003185 [Phlyctochytrium bullatum]|nr:hypothetical protein HDU96_003185 [Phlyctochytrium bullatum]